MIKLYFSETVLISLIVVLMYCLILLGCEKSISESEVQGEVEIKYTLTDWDHPTVIWLSDGNKNYLRTIYVSDWLSNNGYLLPYVCPEWNGISDWDNTNESEVDAVTSATPGIGVHEVVLNCKEEEIAPGEYYYLIESHVQNEYNILYTGKITIGDLPNSNVAEVSYVPEAHSDPARRDVLSNVSAEYRIIDK